MTKKNNARIAEILIVVGIAAILLFIYDKMIFSRVSLNSDDAYEFQVVYEFFHGNPFLNEWLLGGYNFLTTDLIYMAVGVLMRGYSYSAASLAYAVDYIGLLITGWILLRTDNGDEKRIILPQGIFYLLMLFLPNVLTADSVRYHTGAVIWCILALVAACRYRIDDHNSKRRILLFIVSFCTVMGCIGDSIPIFIFVIPVISIFTIKCLKANRIIRDPDCYIALSTLAGVILSRIFMRVFFFIGTAKQVNMMAYGFIPLEDIPQSLFAFTEAVLGMTNGYIFRQGMYSYHLIVFFLKFFNFIYVVFVFGIACYTIYSFICKNGSVDYISLVLSMGIIALSMVLIFLHFSPAVRYYGYFPVLFCILFLRNFHDMIKEIPSLTKKLILFALIFMCCMNPAYYYAHQWRGEAFASESEYYYLSEWLSDQGLTHGYASYWNARINHLYSGGKVEVCQIQTSDDGMIEPYYWLCKKEWFDEPAYYVVFDENSDSISAETLVKQFEEPENIEHFGRFSIFIWDYDIHEAVLRDSI